MAENRDRLWSNDAVGLHAGSTLDAEHGRFGDLAEDAVQGNEDSVPSQQELQLGDVPAAAAATEQSPAKVVPSPAADGMSGLWPRYSIGEKMVAPLKPLGRAPRLWAGDAVERTPVEPALEERKLQRSHFGRGSPCRRSGGARRGGEQRQDAGATAHETD